MKTTIKTSGLNSLEAVMIKPRSNILPFGSGYQNFLMVAASMDTDEPAASRMAQPLRYLSAVEPMNETASSSRLQSRQDVSQTIGQGFGAAISQAERPAGELLSLRDAVIALRRKILIS